MDWLGSDFVLSEFDAKVEVHGLPNVVLSMF